MNDFSEKKILIALLLCFFLGFLGIHRFYVGKIWTGVLWLVTGGIFGIGVVVDFVMLVLGIFKDSENKKLGIWI